MGNLINEKKSVHDWIDLMLTIPNQQKEVGWYECIDLIPKEEEEEETDWTKVPCGALVELSESVYLDGSGISKEPRICKFVGCYDRYVLLDVREYSTALAYGGFRPTVCRLVEGGRDA